jgi:transposase
LIDNNCPAYEIYWPPKGADMNPIENAWAQLQKLVSKKIREDGRPDSREELWHYISDSWDQLK